MSSGVPPGPTLVDFCHQECADFSYLAIIALPLTGKLIDFVRTPYAEAGLIESGSRLAPLLFL